MDIDLARTFLEVVATGNFVGAAERLHVTQSTVSTRVRSLEEQLGCRLFLRGKGGASLTSEGDQFQRYALSLVRIWEQARHHVAIPAGFEESLAIGAQDTLWDRLLLKWLLWMRKMAPKVVLRARLGGSDTLMHELVEGTLDIGVMYTPQSRPGFKVEMLLEEELVLVSTEPVEADIEEGGYVYVDWGPDFRSTHNLTFPDMSNTALFVGPGLLGLDYILENGGSGYFRSRVVQPYLSSGQLFLVPNAPRFSRPAYLVFRDDDRRAMLDTALRGLRQLADSKE